MDFETLYNKIHDANINPDNPFGPDLRIVAVYWHSVGLMIPNMSEYMKLHSVLKESILHSNNGMCEED